MTRTLPVVLLALLGLTNGAQPPAHSSTVTNMNVQAS